MSFGVAALHIERFTQPPRVVVIDHYPVLANYGPRDAVASLRTSLLLLPASCRRRGRPSPRRVTAQGPAGSSGPTEASHAAISAAAVAPVGPAAS